MSQLNPNLLRTLQESIEKIEHELSECKRIIELLESSQPGDSLQGLSIVQKIETEYQDNIFETLSWLVSSKSRIHREDIIALLREGGIVIPKNITKSQISGAVKQVLQTRYISPRSGYRR